MSNPQFFFLIRNFFNVNLYEFSPEGSTTSLPPSNDKDDANNARARNIKIKFLAMLNYFRAPAYDLIIKHEGIG